LAPVKKSTPTKGLEILYDLMPEIMARIRETVQPNNWDGLGLKRVISGYGMTAKV
jgi:hypothetical protein